MEGKNAQPMKRVRPAGGERQASTKEPADLQNDTRNAKEQRSGSQGLRDRGEGAAARRLVQQKIGARNRLQAQGTRPRANQEDTDMQGESKQTALPIKKERGAEIQCAQKRQKGGGKELTADHRRSTDGKEEDEDEPCQVAKFAKAHVISSNISPVK